MSRVLIAGYYGFGNAGDELILESILSGFRRDFPGALPVVLSHNPGRTSREHGVRAADRWNPAAVVKEMVLADSFLLGGGGILQDSTSSASLWYYLALVRLAALLGKRIVVAAAGIGPVSSPLNRRLTGSALREALEISVRDGGSASALEAMGLGREVFSGADPALLFDGEEGAEDKSAGAPVVLFVPRSLPAKRFPALMKDASAALGAFARETGARVRVVPFHHERDREEAARCAAVIGGGAALEPWEGLAGLRRKVRGSDLVVSARMHGLALSCLFRIPALGLSVDPKVAAFAAAAGFPAFERGDFPAALRSAWRGRDSIRDSAAARLPGLRSLAGEALARALSAACGKPFEAVKPL